MFNQVETSTFTLVSTTTPDPPWAAFSSAGRKSEAFGTLPLSGYRSGGDWAVAAAGPRLIHVEMLTCTLAITATLGWSFFAVLDWGTLPFLDLSVGGWAQASDAIVSSSAAHKM